MKTVVIKPWFMMEREFGLDRLGGINCKNAFTEEMERLIPEHRILEIDNKGFWKTDKTSFNISEDMILGDFIPMGTKGIAWDDDKEEAVQCWFESYGLDDSGFKCNVSFVDSSGNAYKNFEPLTEEPEVKEPAPTQEEINRVLDYLRGESK